MQLHTNRIDKFSKTTKFIKLFWKVTCTTRKFQQKHQNQNDHAIFVENNNLQISTCLNFL